MAGFAELDHCLLLGRPARSRGLDEYRAADAAHFSAALRFRAARGESVPLRLPYRLLEQTVRIAAVVDRVGARRLIRKRVLRDQIAPAQLEPIDTRLPRPLLPQP